MSFDNKLPLTIDDCYFLRIRSTDEDENYGDPGWACEYIEEDGLNPLFLTIHEERPEAIRMMESELIKCGYKLKNDKKIHPHSREARESKVVNHSNLKGGDLHEDKIHANNMKEVASEIAKAIEKAARKSDAVLNYSDEDWANIKFYWTEYLTEKTKK